MHWRKRDLWKVGITITGLLLLLMTWIPVSAATVHERASGLATPGTMTVQATPTEDATVTALNKEKLAQEVQQLKNQNAPDPLGWLRTNASFLFSTLIVVGGGLFGFWRWRVDRQAAQDKELKDRQDEREKRAEERFQAAVEGLSSERKEAKIGAAILLRTFLRPGYESFYTQTFDLAVAHLCPTETPHSAEDPEAPLILTTLRQALIVAFKEAFPLARSLNTGSPQSLDATYIQLDNAYLRGADLKQVWMPQASLRNVDLSEANLSGAHIIGANLSGAYLLKTHLSKTNLIEANLRGANLRRADLQGAALYRADLTEANLTAAHLTHAHLSGADFTEADLTAADLSWANLSGDALEKARCLEGTILKGVTGLTKEQLDACKAKGAIVDEDSTTSVSQSAVAPLPPSQSNDVQASSAPSPQDNVPPSHVDENSAVVPAQDSPDEH